MENHVKKHISLGDQALAVISRRYPLRREDIGPDARLSKRLMTFETESYAVEGLGHLCVLRMKTTPGIMAMETVVLSSVQKDLPLFNLDWVRVLRRETLIAELYDTQLSPCAQSALGAFEQVKTGFSDLADPPPSGEHWYDSLLYPCSCRKTGKGVSGRLSELAEQYLLTFAEQADAACTCDAAAKQARVTVFAETLLAKGGPAVDQVVGLFGRETAQRLILRHMYGADR